MKVLLSINYEIEYIGCCSMILMKKKEWEIIRNKLRKIRDTDRENKEKYDKDKREYKGRFVHVWCVDAYLSVPPMEFYGDSMHAEDVLKNVKVEKDQKKVDAFKTLFGKKFNCGSDDNFFDQIIYQIKKYEDELEKEKQREKEESDDE